MMRHPRAIIALALVAPVVLTACSQGVSEPGIPTRYVMEAAPSPAPCGRPCGCLGISAYWRLADPAAGLVSVEATAFCGFQEYPLAAVLIEPLDAPCSSRLVPIQLTDSIAETGGFEGGVNVGGQAVRLTVIQGWIPEARQVACGVDGCLDLALDRWAMSESVILRPADR